MPSSHGSNDGFAKSSMLIDADNDDRLGFVRKVYGILATQLCVTFGFVAMVATIDGLGESILAYPGLYITALILGFAIQCAILCCKSVAR